MARAGVLGFPGLRGMRAGGGVATVPLVMDSGYQFGSITFSNSDATAVGTRAGNYDGAYSDAIPDSGKYYMEFTNGVEDGNGGWGLTTRTTLVEAHPTEQVTNFVAWRSNNVTNGAAGTGFSALSFLGASWSGSTSRFGLAIDMDAGKVWVRQDSATWVNSGDPEGGTGNVGTVPAGSTALKLYFLKFIMPGCGVAISSPADHVYTAPSGFTLMGGA